MKTIKIILLAALGFGPVLTGCTKKQSATGMDYTSSPSNNNSATLAYKMAVENGIVPQSGLQWTEGAISVNKLIFTGRLDGAVDQQIQHETVQLKMDRGIVSYTTTVYAPINIYKPFTSDLMAIPAGKYSDINIGMTLGLDAPLNNPDMPPMRMAVSLTGTYFYKGRMVPIYFLIHDPQFVNMKWTSNLILIGKNAYNPEITINVSKFTNNMPADIFNTATLMDGMITIDENTNTNLYNMMLANLPSVFTVRFK